MSKRKPAMANPDFIEENLKLIFQEELDRELPDRFLNLIERLRSEESDTSKVTKKEVKK